MSSEDPQRLGEYQILRRLGQGGQDVVFLARPARLRAEGSSSMRWGADLHCSGRLRPAKGELEFRLDQVKGDMCYPGTLRVLPSADPDQIVINVTRTGQNEVTYSGKVFRGS